MAGRRHAAEHWQAWFEEFEQSGLTVEQFCRSVGTSPNTFYLWRKKLGLGSVRSKSASRRLSSLTSLGLVPVTPIASPLENHVEIELPGRAKVRVENDRASLRPILQVLFELESP